MCVSIFWFAVSLRLYLLLCLIENKNITFSCFVHTTDTFSQHNNRKSCVKILYWKIHVEIRNILYGICKFVLLIWSKKWSILLFRYCILHLTETETLLKNYKKKEKTKSQQHRNWSSALLQAMSISTRHRPIPDIPIPLKHGNVCNFFLTLKYVELHCTHVKCIYVCIVQCYEVIFGQCAKNILRRSYCVCLCCILIALLFASKTIFCTHDEYMCDSTANV